MTPRLWGRASSVNVQKVMWALAECAIDHERIDAGGKYGKTDTEAYAAMNPLRQVPVWQVGEFSLWESHAILRHLSRGPAASLWPDGAEAQAKADQWMDFAATTLSPSMTGVFFETFRHPLEKRSAEKLARHVAALDVATDVLEAELASSNWLAGEEFSIADIAAGSFMYRYHTLEFPRPERPALSAWYDKLSTRAAYRDTVMTSYEELRGA